MKIIKIVFLLAGIITLAISFNEYFTDVNYKETTKCCKITYITQEYDGSRRETDYIFVLEHNGFTFTKEVGIITASKYKEGDVLRCIHRFPYAEFKDKIGHLVILAHSFNYNKNEWWELVDVYLLSNETPKSGNIVLTDNYGVWEFREVPCTKEYWGNPNTCKKILKPTDLKYEMDRFDKDELNNLIKEYNEFNNSKT